MKMRSMARVVIGIALVAAFTVPTEAQTSPAASTSSGGAAASISAGYNFYSENAPYKTNGLHLNVPLGFYVGVNTNGVLGLVGEIDGGFTSVERVSLSVWTFLGGVRVTGKNGQTKPYGQVLAGIRRGTNRYWSDNSFTIAPGAGIDIMGSGSRVGVRLQGTALLERNSGVWITAFTFGVGIVFGAGTP